MGVAKSVIEQTPPTSGTFRYSRTGGSQEFHWLHYSLHKGDHTVLEYSRTEKSHRFHQNTVSGLAEVRYFLGTAALLNGKSSGR